MKHKNQVFWHEEYQTQPKHKAMMYTELVREGSFVTVDVPAIVGIRIGP